LRPEGERRRGRKGKAMGNPDEGKVWVARRARGGGKEGKEKKGCIDHESPVGNGERSGGKNVFMQGHT